MMRDPPSSAGFFTDTLIARLPLAATAVMVGAPGAVALAAPALLVAAAAMIATPHNTNKDARGLGRKLEILTMVPPADPSRSTRFARNLPVPPVM